MVKLNGKFGGLNFGGIILAACNIGWKIGHQNWVNKNVAFKKYSGIWWRVIHLTESRWPNEYDQNWWTWPKSWQGQTLTWWSWPKIELNITTMTNVKGWICPKIRKRINIATTTNSNQVNLTENQTLVKSCFGINKLLWERLSKRGKSHKGTGWIIPSK